MNEHDVIYQVRESFSALRMDTPVEEVLARSRARRRRRLAGLTATTAATAGAAAIMALTLGGTTPTLPGHPSARSGHPAAVSPGTVKLAAFSVSDGPGTSTTLILRRYGPLDPTALRQALSQHGIPALVTVGTFCRSNPGVSGFDQVVQPSTLADGTDVIVINGQAMPSGTELSIGLFPRTVRMLLIEEGVPLSCSSTAGQPNGLALSGEVIL
jgi:hypothetical protein